MRPNRLRDNRAKQCGSINGWLAIPHAFSAETMAHQGWDSLTLDMQHGLIDYAAAVNMLTAIASTDTAALVRVPWLDPGIIMRMLDAGAGGIICPMVNSAADAERFVSAMRYPPLGQRSFGPIRALLHYGADYAEHANRDTLAVQARPTCRCRLAARRASTRKSPRWSRPSRTFSSGPRPTACMPASITAARPMPVACWNRASTW